MPVCFRLRAAPVSESKLGGTTIIHVVADQAFLAVDVVVDLVAARFRIREPRYLCTTQRSSGRSQSLSARLRINLPAAFHDFSVKAAIDVRVGFCGVVVIVARRVFVTVEPVESL